MNELLQLVPITKGIF